MCSEHRSCRRSQPQHRHLRVFLTDHTCQQSACSICCHVCVWHVTRNSDSAAALAPQHVFYAACLSCCTPLPCANSASSRVRASSMRFTSSSSCFLMLQLNPMQHPLTTALPASHRVPVSATDPYCFQNVSIAAPTASLNRGSSNARDWSLHKRVVGPPSSPCSVMKCGLWSECVFPR